MKNIFLPMSILLFVVLGCVPPKTKQKQESFEDVAAKPSISYSKPTIENAANIYTILHFEVTNTSTKPIEFLQIHASFYDKDGSLITSESPYIEQYTSLGPGERSAATVSTNRDRRIANYELTFTAHGDGPFEKVNVFAQQIDPPSKSTKKKK